MKTVMAVLAVLVMAGSAGAVNLLCDSTGGATSFRVTGITGVGPTVPANASGNLSVNIDTASTGLNSVSIRACKTTPPWPEVCSNPFLYSFTRPEAPSTPTNARLE